LNTQNDHFAFDLYGYETWSPTLRAEQTDGVGEQGAQEIIGLKRYEVIEGWRKLHNEELINCILCQV
jgi:hypothetical protein